MIGAGSRERRERGESRRQVSASFRRSRWLAGFLFVSLYGGVLGDLESLLFGDLLGISDGQVWRSR